MRRIIIALGLTLALAGCSTIQKLETAFQVVTGDVVAPQAVVVAINAFDAAEAIATNYVKLPRCGTGKPVCRDPVVTARVITFVRAGRADRNQLKAGLRANPGQSLSLVDVYNDLGNTTSALVALVRQ